MHSLLDFVYSKSTLLLSIILLTATTVFIGVSKAELSDKQDTIEKLPYCGNDADRDVSRRLLYVSTLDGTVSALDIENNGELKWSLKTNPGPLLSSSIHRLELTNNGQWIRMIPSLAGSLYNFDGETVERIPVTVDHLLSSSFRLSPELVISGGKETRSYGVSARTGKILYECSMHDCRNITDFDEDESEKHGPPRAYQIEDLQHDPLLDDVIVVRRQTQTVRAVEVRTGAERWNFSVGHHDLEVVKPNDCHAKPNNKLDKSLLDLQLKVIVPEGIICAVRKDTPNIILWQHKFDFPIVNAWKSNQRNELESVDLFSLLKLPININTKSDLTPSIYVGMFNNQLYIQESSKLVKSFSDNNLEIINREYLKIPWKPYPATESALAIIQDDAGDSKVERTDTSATALSILYASKYINGNGFYLYSKADLNKTQNDLCDKENATNPVDSDKEHVYEFFDDDDTPAKIIIVSLWFWWKEIMVISLTTALILNVVLSRRLTHSREVVIVERHVEIKVPMATEPQLEEILPRQSFSDGDNFISRFQTDFDMVQCLGKGGFGVVFESKNKLDDCKYAIKRIMLPNRQESRERVMREVKTLAHCEHQNIVRYFQAWVETPPSGWQDKEDRIWMDREALSHSIDIDSPSEPSPPPNKISNKIINKNDRELDSWISHLNTNECINFDDHNRKTAFTDSDSFIQFKDDTESDSVFNNVNKNNHVEDSFDVVFRADCTDETGHSNKRSTAGSYSSGSKPKITKTNLTSDVDSFQIEFKNSTNGVKQRTQSDNYGNMKKDSIYQNGNDTENGCSRNNSKVEPFKKTHRRPISLDLSNQRKRIEIFNSNRMYLYIQMQLCKKQSLRDWLRMNHLESRQRDIVSIFKQIVEGVEYCHLKGLIHRDLKPSNIFFSLDDQIKIGDFGLVTDMSDIPNTPCADGSGLPSRVKHTEQVGTHLYMSPEQLQGKQYNYKVDIYSLGLIFFELLVVFGTEMERIETLKSLRVSIFPVGFSESFNDEFKLLKIMLSQSPQERPTTIGIRGRPPLGYGNNITNDWHFELPPRRRDSHVSGSSSNSSINYVIQ